MRVLGFGTYDVRRHPRVGILLDGLAAACDDVVELNRPMGFSTAQRVAILQHPTRAWRLLTRLLVCWAQLIGAAVRNRSRFRPDAVVVGYLAQFDVLLARLVFPRRRIVLDNLVFTGDTAADRGARTTSIRVRLLGALDRLAMRCADVIVVDTEEHADLVPDRWQDRVVVAPVGAPRTWFTSRPVPREETGLRVVFYGLFTPLQGTVTIAAAAALLADRPDIEITMLGAGQDLPAARTAAAGNPRVTWIDLVEPDVLPALVTSNDVCLGIFGTGPKALRVVPNKVFQGAAAGCAVVTSDTEPQRRLLGEDAVFVPPGDPVALAAALRDLADDPDHVLDLRRRAWARAAARFGPETVAEPVRTALLRTVGRGR